MKDRKTTMFATTCYEKGKNEQQECNRLFFPVPYKIPPKHYGPDGTFIAFVCDTCLMSIYYVNFENHVCGLFSKQFIEPSCMGVLVIFILIKSTVVDINKFFYAL